METSLYGMTVGKSRKASNVRITDGEVSGSAKDEVDDQRIKIKRTDQMLEEFLPTWHWPYLEKNKGGGCANQC